MDMSIIIPCHNLENFIGVLIDSYKRQQHTCSVEYIFVLDACTDMTKGIIEHSGLECIILECDERSCGIARNIGMDVAKGKYVWFNDGDDWLTDDYAIQKAFDFAQGKHLCRINYASTYHGYYSMVWQYVFSRQLINGIRFRREMPGEDDKFTKDVFDLVGISVDNFMDIQAPTDTLYFYNYGREGSNMFRHNRGEQI